MNRLAVETMDIVVQNLYNEHMEHHLEDPGKSGLGSLSALCLACRGLRDITLPWLYRSFNSYQHHPYSIRLFVRTLLENRARISLIRELCIQPDTSRREDNPGELTELWKPSQAQLARIGKVISRYDEATTMHISRAAEVGCSAAWQLLLLALATNIRSLYLGVHDAAMVIDEDDLNNKCCFYCPNYQILVPTLITHHPTNGPQGNAYARLSRVYISGASDYPRRSGLFSTTSLAFMSLPSMRIFNCSHASSSAEGDPLPVLSGATHLNMNHARLSVGGLKGFLSSVKALEHLQVQWYDHPHEDEPWFHIGGSQLKSALATQQHSLRYLDLTIFKSFGYQDTVMSQVLPLGSLRNLVKLETLKIDELMLVGTEDAGREWTQLYPNELFPRTLKDLEIHSIMPYTQLAFIFLSMSRYAECALTSFKAIFMDTSGENKRIFSGNLRQPEDEAYSFDFYSWRGSECVSLHCWQTPNMREWFDHTMKRIKGCAKQNLPEGDSYREWSWREEMEKDVAMELMMPLFVAGVRARNESLTRVEQVVDGEE